MIEGLIRVFERSPGPNEPEFQLAGSAASFPEALPLITEVQPKIVLLDQSGGLKSVFRFLTDLKAAVPSALPVLWVSEMAEVDCFRALQVGARGIVKRTMPVDSFLDCLRSVARGSIWIENNIPGQMSGFFSRRQSPRLTPREREIVQCLCRGMRNKEIATELSITPGTVKVHLMHIFEKTGVKDRFELAVHGRKLLGIDPVEPGDEILPDLNGSVTL